MIQNLVLNNSDHNFSMQWDQVRADMDQPKVVATPGTVAAVAADLRSELESGALVPRGFLGGLPPGHHADFRA